MQRILNQTHNKFTFLYASSRLFERASFYGLRSLMILYMVSESFNMSSKEALTIYGWLGASIVISQVLGALLGDLVIGNKKSIIIGGILQAIGAFSFCIPSIMGLYIGIFFVVIGSGFYTPNMISQYGKLYLNKTKLLDSAFTIFYLAINIGAIYGTLLVGYFGETYGWNIGFITAGVLMLISISFLLIPNEINNTPIPENTTTIDERIIKIAVAIIVIGLFWAIYEISNIRFRDIQMKFIEYSNLGLPRSFWTSINTAFTIPISLFAIILWSYFYSNQFIKLIIGFIFGILSFGILFFIPEIPSDQHIILYIASLLFLAIAEIHIAPVIQSILTQYTNPKYLAIIISLAFIPTRLISYIIGFFSSGLYANPSYSLKLAFIALVVICIGLVLFTFLYRNKKPLITFELEGSEDLEHMHPKNKKDKSTNHQS